MTASPVTDNPPGERPSRVRYLVLVLACGISFVLYLQRYAWGFIKQDLQREFGWDTRELGWLDGLFAMSYGLVQVPSGIVCDWFGARVLLGASILTWSCGLFAFTLASTLGGMAVLRLTFGVAQASCYPVLNKVSKNWFPLTMRSTAQAWIATFFGRVGGAFAFFLIGTVLLGWLELSWRLAVGILAALGFGWGLLFLALFRNSPRQHFWANEAEAELIVAGDPQAAIVAGSKVYWPALVRRGTFWLLMARAVTTNLPDVFFVNWMPMYLDQIKGIKPVHSGWMSALPLLGGAAGGIASGLIQSWFMRRGSRRLARGGVGAGCKFIAGFIMLASLGIDSGLALIGLFVIVKFFTDMEQPVEWGAVGDLAGSNTATVFACVNMMGAFGGLLAGPLVGWILHLSAGPDGHATAAGWNMLFGVMVVEYLATGLIWAFVDTRKPLQSGPSN